MYLGCFNLQVLVLPLLMCVYAVTGVSEYFCAHASFREIPTCLHCWVLEH